MRCGLRSSVSHSGISGGSQYSPFLAVPMPMQPWPSPGPSPRSSACMPGLGRYRGCGPDGLPGRDGVSRCDGWGQTVRLRSVPRGKMRGDLRCRIPGPSCRRTERVSIRRHGQSLSAGNGQLESRRPIAAPLKCRKFCVNARNTHNNGYWHGNCVSGSMTGARSPVRSKSIFAQEERRLCLKLFTTSCGGRECRAAAL